MLKTHSAFYLHSMFNMMKALPIIYKAGLF
nr:MAG TPA: hypothetical protein [Caudoviricetes sp.]